MTRKASNLKPRREFLRLAAFTGAAALTGNGVAAAGNKMPVHRQRTVMRGDDKMEFLRVSGRHIVNAKGKQVRLRGTCPGGWMNMEDFINGHPGAEHTLRAQMAEVLGPARAQFFFERMLDYFFNEDDVIFLRKAGASVVRIPLNYRHFEDDAAPFKYKEAGFARLDKVLSHCEKHGLYVILDLHSAQGWQNVHWHSDNASRISLFWDGCVLSGSLRCPLAGVCAALQEQGCDRRLRCAERALCEQRHGRLSMERGFQLQAQF